MVGELLALGPDDVEPTQVPAPGQDHSPGPGPISGQLGHDDLADGQHGDLGHDPQQVVHQLIFFADKARRNGMVSLDADLTRVPDGFLKKSLMLAVDGTEPQELRKMMQLEIDNQTEYEDNIPKVFESAGGFAPTIGIIGAVLGLIQVMQHLDNINEVGKGIAVAFVATVYGVGSANLFFLPSAGKLRLRIRDEQILREMTLEGVISILEGMNPRMLETKLVSFLQDAPHKRKRRQGDWR